MAQRRPTRQPAHRAERPAPDTERPPPDEEQAPLPDEPPDEQEELIAQEDPPMANETPAPSEEAKAAAQALKEQNAELQKDLDEMLKVDDPNVANQRLKTAVGALSPTPVGQRRIGSTIVLGPTEGLTVPREPSVAERQKAMSEKILGLLGDDSDNDAAAIRHRVESGIMDEQEQANVYMFLSAPAEKAAREKAREKLKAKKAAEQPPPAEPPPA